MPHPTNEAVRDNSLDKKVLTERPYVLSKKEGQ
jgi:hypothetical protein